MSVYLDEAIAHHPKFVEAGPVAFGLFVAGLCYCKCYGTQGHIPKAAVPHLLPGVSGCRARELARRLATNGSPPSWIDEGDSFRVHDYEDYQVSCDPGCEQARRSGNAERQRRFRQRRATRGGARREVAGAATAEVRGERRDPTRGAARETTAGKAPDVTHDVERDVTPSVTRDVARDVTRDVTPRMERDVTPVTLRVTRDITAGVTRYVTPGRNGEPAPVTAGVTGDGHRDRTEITPDDQEQVTRDRNDPGPRVAVGSPSGPCPPSPAVFPSPPLPPLPSRPEVTAVTREAETTELDPVAGFAAWYGAYPRQEGEAPARHAWRRQRERPPLEELLERLAVQKAAKPEAAFWPAPERYLRERRWCDSPPPRPAARPRSADAERRALGSDESRRERLREISERARFDPQAPRDPEEPDA
jgi:hypothetical protein